MMNRMMSIVFATTFAITLLLAGCASGDSGQVVSSILQGIGQGLSGWPNQRSLELRQAIEAFAKSSNRLLCEGRAKQTVAAHLTGNNKTIYNTRHENHFGYT